MAPSSAVERAVRGWLNHLDVERGVSANTLASYRRDLARYTAYLKGHGVREPADATERHVTDFLATLREGSTEHPPLAASSAARTLVAVRGFHRFLHRERRIAARHGHAELAQEFLALVFVDLHGSVFSK